MQSHVTSSGPNVRHTLSYTITAAILSCLQTRSREISFGVTPHYLTNTYVQLGTLKIYIDCNDKDNGKRVTARLRRRTPNQMILRYIHKGDCCVRSVDCVHLFSNKTRSDVVQYQIAPVFLNACTKYEASDIIVITLNVIETTQSNNMLTLLDDYKLVSNQIKILIEMGKINMN